jgi:hypothetical protein
MVMVKDNREEVYYVGKVNDWDGSINFDSSKEFTNVPDAREYADKTYWPSDELVILQIVDRRDNI